MEIRKKYKYIVLSVLLLISTLFIIEDAEAGKKSRITDSGMALDYGYNLTGGNPVDRRREFTPDDDCVVWWCQIKKFSTWGNPKMLVKWFTPKGELYKEEKFTTPYACTLYAKTKLPIKGVLSTDLFGEWRVEIFWDKELVDEQMFSFVQERTYNAILKDTDRNQKRRYNKRSKIHINSLNLKKMKIYFFPHYYKVKSSVKDGFCAGDKELIEKMKRFFKESKSIEITDVEYIPEEYFIGDRARDIFVPEVFLLISKSREKDATEANSALIDVRKTIEKYCEQKGFKQQKKDDEVILVVHGFTGYPSQQEFSNDSEYIMPYGVYPGRYLYPMGVSNVRLQYSILDDQLKKIILEGTTHGKRLIYQRKLRAEDDVDNLLPVSGVNTWKFKETEEEFMKWVFYDMFYDIPKNKE